MSHALAAAECDRTCIRGVGVYKNMFCDMRKHVLSNTSGNDDASISVVWGRFLEVSKMMMCRCPHLFLHVFKMCLGCAGNMGCFSQDVCWS